MIWNIISEHADKKSLGTFCFGEKNAIKTYERKMYDFFHGDQNNQY